MPLADLLKDPLILQGVKAAIVLGAYLVAATIARIVVGRLGIAHEHDALRIRSTHHTVRMGLRLLFAVILLIVLGVDLAVIPAFLGSFLAIVGVACFAAWSILTNVTAGLVIFAAKDLQVGDKVRIIDERESLVGTVMEFRLWSVVLRLDDGGLAYVPNIAVVQRVSIILACARPRRTTQLLQQAPPGG
jgi:small-conductance mechanosensitive channel